MTFPLSADSEHDVRERFMAKPDAPGAGQRSDVASTERQLCRQSRAASLGQAGPRELPQPRTPAEAQRQVSIRPGGRAPRLYERGLGVKPLLRWDGAWL